MMGPFSHWVCKTTTNNGSKNDTTKRHHSLNITEPEIFSFQPAIAPIHGLARAKPMNYIGLVFED